MKFQLFPWQKPASHQFQTREAELEDQANRMTKYLRKWAVFQYLVAILILLLLGTVTILQHKNVSFTIQNSRSCPAHLLVSHHPKPTPTPKATVTPKASPSPTATATPKATATPSPKATATPTPTPSSSTVTTAIPKPTPSPSATPTPKATTTPTPTPAKPKPPVLSTTNSTPPVGGTDGLTATGLNPGDTAEFVDTSTGKVIGTCTATGTSCVVQTSSAQPGNVTYQATDTTTGLPSNKITVNWVAQPPTLTATYLTPYVGTVDPMIIGNLVPGDPSLFKLGLPSALGHCIAVTTHCDVVVTSTVPGKVTYQALVGATGLKSNTVTVDWLAASVSPSPSPSPTPTPTPTPTPSPTPTATPPTLAAASSSEPVGQNDALTVGGLGSDPANVYTSGGTLIGSCTGSGGSCVVNATATTTGSVTYVATDTTTGLSSNTVTVNWTAPPAPTSFTLTSSQYGFWYYYQTPTLTATSNVPGNIAIFRLASSSASDVTNGNLALIEYCANTTTCVLPLNQDFQALYPGQNAFIAYYTTPTDPVWSNSDTPIWLYGNVAPNPSANYGTPLGASIPPAISWTQDANGTLTFTASRPTYPNSNGQPVYPLNYCVDTNGASTPTCTPDVSYYNETTNNTVPGSSASFDYGDGTTSGFTNFLPSENVAWIVSAGGETWQSVAANVPSPTYQWVGGPGGDFINPSLNLTDTYETVSTTPAGAPTLCTGIDCGSNTYCQSSTVGNDAYCGQLGSAWDSMYLQLRLDTTHAVVAVQLISSTTPAAISYSSPPAATYSTPSPVPALVTLDNGATPKLSVPSATPLTVTQAAGSPLPNNLSVSISSGTSGSYLNVTLGKAFTVADIVSASLPTGPGLVKYNVSSGSAVIGTFSIDWLKTQTITFTSTPPTNAAVGSTYTPTATASSGLAVTITVDSASSTVCSINSSGTVTFNTPGPCVLDANQAGNSTYAAASQVQQTTGVPLKLSVSSTAPVDGSTVTFTASQAEPGMAYQLMSSFYASGPFSPPSTNPAGTGQCTVASSATSCTIAFSTDNGNNSGTLYYEVIPVTTGSPTSNIVSLDWTASSTPLSQTITFTSTPPSNPTIGGTYDVTATSSSGLLPTITIDSSSSSVCSIFSGYAVTFNTAGTCTIDANQAGDSSFAAAPQVQQTITVPAGTTAQTITFTSTAPSSPTVGGTYTPTATASSGLTVALTISSSSSSVCSMSSSGVVTFNTSGSCVIDANQAGNSTYAAAPQVQQTVTVAASTLQAQTITFGDTAPLSAPVGSTYYFYASATSGLKVALTIDSASSSVCSILNGTVTFNGTGTCTVDANQAGNGTYAAAPQVQQSVTVTPPPPTLSVSSSTPPAGGTVTFTVAGGTAGTTYELSGGTSSTGSFSPNFDNTAGTGTCTVASGATSCTISYATTATGSLYFAVAPQGGGARSNIVTVTWG